MGKKRATFTQQLIAFAMADDTTEVLLNAAIETLIAVRVSRFPVAAKPKPRAVRSDAGKSRQSRLNPPARDTSDASLVGGS